MDTKTRGNAAGWRARLLLVAALATAMYCVSYAAYCTQGAGDGYATAVRGAAIGSSVGLVAAGAAKPLLISGLLEGNAMAGILAVQITDYMPAIIEFDVQPVIVRNGSAASIFVSASNAEYIWALVDYPDGAQTTVTLANYTNASFSDTALTGTYGVTCIVVNSNISVTAQAKKYFISGVPMTLNVSTLTPQNQSLDSEVSVSYLDEEVAAAQSQDGSAAFDIINASPDMLFRIFNATAQVLLRNVSLSADGRMTMTADKYAGNSFDVAYGLLPDAAFTSATVTLHYDPSLGLAEQRTLHIYKCGNYSMENRTCESEWDDLTQFSAQNYSGRYFALDVDSFSGFGIKSEATPTPTPTPTSTASATPAASSGAGSAWGGASVPYEAGTPTPTASGRANESAVAANASKVVCVRNWLCSAWENCTAGTMRRACADSNGCDKALAAGFVDQVRGPERPAESAGCTAYCNDGIRNYGESDADCGGNCAACVNGKRCVTPADCEDNDCVDGRCVAKAQAVAAGKPAECATCGKVSYELAFEAIISVMLVLGMAFAIYDALMRLPRKGQHRHAH